MSLRECGSYCGVPSEAIRGELRLRLSTFPRRRFEMSVPPLVLTTHHSHTQYTMDQLVSSPTSSTNPLQSPSTVPSPAHTLINNPR